MKIINICLLFLFVLLSGCNNPKSEFSKMYKYNINIKDTLDQPLWNDLVDSICYIPLKTDSNIILDVVEQIVVNSENIFILANGVYCFDMEGICKYTITNRGRARNEFLDATSISVSNGYVYLYDKMKQKVIVFDSNTGKYNYDIDMPIGGRKVYYSDDSFIFENAQSDDANYTRFKLYNESTNCFEKNGFFMGKEHIGHVAGTCSWSNDGLLYSSFLRNLAWKIKGNECIPYIKVIVPEDKRLSDKDIRNMISDKTISSAGYNSPNAIIGLTYLSECDNCITGRLSNEQQFIFFVYDKVSGNSMFFSRFVDSEPWKFFPVGECCIGEGNYMYMMIPSDAVMLTKNIFGGVGQEPSDSLMHKAYDVISSTKDNDNPIIAKFRLKKL